jgi:hypothetical protein
MNNFILVLSLLIFIAFAIISSFKTVEPFGTVKGWNLWPHRWGGNRPIWNISTRMRPYFYDVRGDPNVVYRRHQLGPFNVSYIPYGYLFGPHMYDIQGNFITNPEGKFYIA